VDVQNFSRSWQDGLAFAALINKFRPDLLNYDEMLARKDDPMFVMQSAFDAAEKAGISKLLDAEDIVNSAKPDDKSIIAYLSMW
jgi:actinin alpha